MNYKHGLTGTRTYVVWRNMRHRCEKPDHKSYHRYGGRGITVCERWKTFTNFLQDMGEAPEGLTLERKNNDGPYSPENCVWATPKEQTRNRSNNNLITFEGRTQCLQAWAEERGIKKTTLRRRLMELGWPVERALA